MPSNSYSAITLGEMQRDLHRRFKMTSFAAGVGASLAITGCGLWVVLLGLLAGLLPVVLGSVWLGWSLCGFARAYRMSPPVERASTTGDWIPGTQSSSAMRVTMSHIAAETMSEADADALIAVHGTDSERSLWALLKRKRQ